MVFLLIFYLYKLFSLLIHSIHRMRNQLLLRNHARCDGHRLQLLEKQFRRIRDMNVGEVRRIRAATTGPDALFGIDHGQEAAVLTGIAGELIGALHQALLRELGHSVCDDTVAFHFRFHLTLQGICSLFHCVVCYYTHSPSRAGLDYILRFATLRAAYPTTI